jgi:hypothetical protein
MRRRGSVGLLARRRAARWRRQKQAEKAAAAWPLAGGMGRGNRPSWAERPGGPAGPLGLEGEMGRHENKNKRNKGNRTGLQGNLGRNGKWAEENMKKMFLEFLFSSFEFETKVKIQIKYIFKFKQV